MRFIINKNGVYYMTTGVLAYDENETKGDARKKEGVAKVAKKFEEEKNSPHTVYEAVLVKDSNFSAVNTR